MIYSLAPEADAKLVSHEYLETLLLRRLGNRVRDLHVVVHPEGIELQGWTTTYHAKQLAQHAALELTDLPLAANNIEVR